MVTWFMTFQRGLSAFYRATTVNLVHQYKSRMFRVGCSASAASLICWSAIKQSPSNLEAAPNASTKVQEKAASLFAELQTGATFPKTLRVPVVGNEPAAETQYLVGVGMRCMLQRCEYALARAYAIGLYVDGSLLTVAKTVGSSTAADNAEAEALALGRNSGVRKTLRLVMSREVAGAHIGKGFDRTLIPRVRQLMGARQGAGKEALKAFTGAFNRAGLLQEGAEVLLAISGPQLRVFIDGRLAAEIDSEVLCEAVAGMYLGPRTVSPKARANLAAGLAAARDAGSLSLSEMPGAARA